MVIGKDGGALGFRDVESDFTAFWAMLGLRSMMLLYVFLCFDVVFRCFDKLLVAF